MKERFVFGVPLIARAVAGDWRMVDHLLGLTLRSALAQDDRDFQLVLAAHDEPPAWGAVAGDPRFALIRTDWTPEPPSAANDDGGRKKWLIKRWMHDAGGGLLMFLDADDWIARDLVATARATIGADDVGGIVADGYALDYVSLRVARFPIAGAFAGPVHGLCGSTTVGRVVPDSDDPVRLDPHLALGSHHEWRERAARDGLALASLDTHAMYVLGTGQNHSEAQGPFASWRRELTEAVRSLGAPLDAELAEAFGQELGTVRPRAAY